MVFDLDSSKYRRSVRLCFKRIALLLTLALLCTACLPLRLTTSPGASGRVLDSQTRAPIAGAEVVISRSTYPPPSVEEAFSNHRSSIVSTDTAGQFSIPPEHGWNLFVLPVDAFPPFGLLVVKRNGYQAALVPMWSRSVKPLGELLLKPTTSAE
jgi:hypothetical protein